MRTTHDHDPRPSRDEHGAARVDVAGVTFVLAGIALALHPAAWLVGTWTHPAFNSLGGWVFLCVCSLAVWSLRTPRARRAPTHTGRTALALLLGTAVVRAGGELLAVHVIGGIALVIDVFALGLLADLRGRRNALSPFWLAALFALTLPVERIAQRVVGYPLQWLSARGACGVLEATWADQVACAGVRISLSGHDVLVDLPCSGTQGLFIVGAVFVGLCALRRPGPLSAAFGIIVALAASVAANSLRIAAIAAGIARGGPLSESFAHGAAHEIVGLLALVLALAPVIVWSWFVPASRATTLPQPDGPVGPAAPRSRASRRASLAAALSAGVATAVLFVPAHPVDVSARFPDLTMPSTLAGSVAESSPLSERERRAYEDHGGTAIRAAYGPHTLLIVRTSSPLRHLHAPDECFAALGAQVRHLGVAWAPVPAAIYRVTAADGADYRVAVTYVSSTGLVATSVAEVVWHWLRDRDSVWTGVQRVTPWDFAHQDGLLVEREIAGISTFPSTQLEADNAHLRTQRRRSITR